MRLFVYESVKTHKSLAVLECEKIDKRKATVTQGVRLDSIRPGMVCCPGEGREPDRATSYTVQGIEGSTIVFEKEALSGVPYTPPEVEGQAS